MKDKNKIFRFILSCITIIIIFGYTIAAEDDEEENTSISFNQAPIVDIIPKNNIINKTTDGSVGLFASNPPANQYAMQVDFLAIIPQGINLYSDTFQLEEKPEVIIGSFQINPGQKRDIDIKVKSKYIGNYSVQYNMLYHPVGIEKDYLKNVIFDYKVEEPSIVNNSINSTINKDNPYNNGSTTKKLDFVSISNTIVILMIIFLYKQKIKN